MLKCPVLSAPSLVEYSCDTLWAAQSSVSACLHFLSAPGFSFLARLLS